MFNFSIISRILVMTVFFLASAVNLLAYPNNDWKSKESAHFIVSYNQNTREIADSTLNIAEETWLSLTSYFQSDLGKRKIAIVLSDNNDYGNGAAYFDMPLVRLDCRKTQNIFRGETVWLRTVLTHELSHIYSFYVLSLGVYIVTQTKFTSEVENIGVNLGGDWGGNNFPQWFIEGLAQMGSHHVGADSHDPIRQMLLGDAYRSGLLLSLAEMSRFE